MRGPGRLGSEGVDMGLQKEVWEQRRRELWLLLAHSPRYFGRLACTRGTSLAMSLRISSGTTAAARRWPPTRAPGRAGPRPCEVTHSLSLRARSIMRRDRPLGW